MKMTFKLPLIVVSGGLLMLGVPEGRVMQKDAFADSRKVEKLVIEREEEEYAPPPQVDTGRAYTSRPRDEGRSYTAKPRGRSYTSAPRNEDGASAEGSYGDAVRKRIEKTNRFFGL